MASLSSRKESLSSTVPEVLVPHGKDTNGAVFLSPQPRSPNGGALVDVQAVGLDSDKPNEESSRKSAQKYSILTEVLAQKRIEVEQLRASFRKKGTPAVSYDADDPKRGTHAVSYDAGDPARLQNKPKQKERSLSPPSSSFRIGSQSPVKMASQSPAPRNPSISPALRLGESSVAEKSRLSLDREFSPKSTDSYTAQRLRDKLREMEKTLVKTQSDLIKEREHGWAIKAQLALDMQGRMKVAEADLKKSKDELEGRYKEQQERAQETRVALDQEKRKNLALEAQIQALATKQQEQRQERRNSVRTDRSYDTDPDELPASNRGDQQTSRSAPELNGATGPSTTDNGTRHIAELVSANATLQEEKALMKKRVLELENDLQALLDNSKAQAVANTSSSSEMLLAEENKTLLRAQLQAQQDLQRKALEIQRLREQLSITQEDTEAEREHIRNESISVHALLGQKTADTARLEDLLRIERLQRMEAEREKAGLHASLVAEEGRSMRFQEQAQRLAADNASSEVELLREQVADLQDELTALHVRLSTQASNLKERDAQAAARAAIAPPSQASSGSGRPGSPPDPHWQAEAQATGSVSRAASSGPGPGAGKFQVDLGEEVCFTVRIRSEERGEDSEEDGEEEREALGEEVREDVATVAGVGEERVEVRGVRRERGSGCTLVDLELLRAHRSPHPQADHVASAPSAQEALGRLVSQLEEKESVLTGGGGAYKAVAIELYWPQAEYPPYRRGESGGDEEGPRKVGGKSQEEWMALVEEQTAQIQAQSARIMAVEEAEKALREKLAEARQRSERVEVGHEGVYADLEDARRELEGWKEAFKRLERQLDEHDALLKGNLHEAERRLQDVKSALLAAEAKASEADSERAAALLQLQAALERAQHRDQLQAQLAHAQAVSDQRETALLERLRLVEEEKTRMEEETARLEEEKKRMEGETARLAEEKRRLGEEKMRTEEERARIAGLLSNQQSEQGQRQSMSEGQLQEERARGARLAEELGHASERVQSLQQRLSELTEAHDTQRRRADELEMREQRMQDQTASQLELERKDKEVLMRDLRQASSALEGLKAKVKELEEVDANVSRMQVEMRENQFEEPLRKAEHKVKVLQERLFEAEASLQRESKSSMDSGLQIKSLQMQGVSLAQTKVQLEDQLEKLTNRHELVVMELNRIKALSAERENEIERLRAESARRESELEARLKEQQERFDSAYAESEKGDENVGLLAWYREELNKAQEALDHRSRLVQTLETEVRSMHARAATLIEAQGLTEQFRSTTAPAPNMRSVREEEEEGHSSPTVETLGKQAADRSWARTPDSQSSPLRMSPPHSSSRPVSLSLSPPQNMHSQPSPSPAHQSPPHIPASPNNLVGPAISPMAVPVMKPTFPSSAHLSLFASKPTYSGQLKDGWPHGRGVTTWADGRMYEGEWNKGVFTGTGTCIWSNGDVYEGEWEDGFAHGLGMYTYATGEKYEGTMQQDKFHGHGAFCDVSGWKYRGGWEHSKMHGWGLVVTRSGEKLRQHFFKGMPAGSPEASDEQYSRMLMAVSEVVNTVRTKTKDLEHSPEVARKIQAARDRRGDASSFSTPFSSPAGTIQLPQQQTTPKTSNPNRPIGPPQFVSNPASCSVGYGRTGHGAYLHGNLGFGLS